MDWSGKRKLLYATYIVLVIVALSVYLFRDTLFPKPACSDGKKNGFETGVDCGGSCLRKCAAEVSPLTVTWSRVLEVGPKLYDVVAFISNKNQDSAPRTLTGTFTVYSAQGIVLFARTISVTPPAATDIPVLIQNIALEERPQRVVFTLAEGTSYRIPELFQKPQISTTQTRFENGDTPRVYATIKNLTRNAILRFPVRIVLYDASDTAYADGETFVERLEKEEEQTLIFTWKKSFDIAPTRIRVYPILDPFSP